MMDASQISQAKETALESLNLIASIVGSNIEMPFIVATAVFIVGFLLFMFVSLIDFVWFVRER